MNFKTLASALFATLMLATAYQNADAAASAKIDRRSKKELRTENDSLRRAVDSLMFRLSRIEEMSRLNDSLADVIIEHYEEERNDGFFVDRDTTISTDSLLSIYYSNRRLNDMTNIELDDVKYESNVPDSVYVRRLSEMNSFITLPYNNVVRNYIILYTEKNKNIGNILGLASYYMPIFEDIFNQYGLPEELKAMAVIESALNPTAVSRANAKGMWQFMYSTAKHYGLQINSFVDERFDPVASAHAAAKYLKDSYNIFGDWSLAIASYNCGAGNVQKAIRRSGNSKDFWEIYNFLPRETRGYVPAFVGALYTLRYYKEHKLCPSPITLPPHVDTIHVTKMLHLEQVSSLTGIKLEELKNLNPQYIHNIIPGNERAYILRIPYNYTNAFIDHEKEVYSYQADKYFNPVELKKIKDGGTGERIVYKVRRGDVLGKIAMRYGVSVAKIKKWNGLRSDNIRIGQRLVIYRGGNGPAASSASGSHKVEGGYVVYTVKSGDNLWNIAKKFSGVTANSIMSLNGLNKNSKIYPGMKLKIKKS